MTMNIKCGICGQEIVIADNVADGQHVKCPICGEKTEFRKPSRIKLPTGAGSRSRTTDSSTLPKFDVSEDLAMPPKPDVTEARKSLHVIRKEATPSADSGSMENQMASKKIYMAEEHARFYEEMKDIELRRKTREKIGSVLMLLAVVLCAAGIYWYVGYRKEQRRQAEIAFAAEQNRLAAERLERERKEQALREESEKAERERRLAEEKRRKEESALLQAEKAREANALLESKVLYRKACALFGDGEFDFLSAMPTNSLPGKVAGEFYYLLPFLDNGEIVICQSSATGIVSVCRLDATGKKTAFEASTFLSSLQGKDYLVAHGENVYFQSKRRKAHVGKISKTEVVDLGKEFFGDIASEVKRLDFDSDDLKFEIVFVAKESKKVIVADTIEYGVQYSLAKVREAIEEAFPMRKSATISSSRKARFRRTVVLWDGARVKKGVDGTTYVPKVAPPQTYGSTTLYGPGWNYGRNYWHNENKRRYRAEYNRAQWQALYDEALKQEEAERRFYEQQDASKEKKQQTVMTQAERAYAEKIDRIYDAGTLYFRARVDRKK